MRPVEYALYGSFVGLYALCAAATIFHPTGLPPRSSVSKVWNNKSKCRDNVIATHCIVLVLLAMAASNLVDAAYFAKPVKYSVLTTHVVMALIPNNFSHTFWVVFLAVIDAWLIARF